MLHAITTGETVFIAPEQTLWAMRQATKIALRDDLPMTRFVVTHEDHYYAQALDGILSDARKRMETTLTLGGKIVGEEDGAWRCAALWSMDSRTGILMHRQGNEVLCAYIPLLDKATAEAEHNAAMALSALAEEVKDMPVYLERGIMAGEHLLSTLLDLLSESLDV